MIEIESKLTIDTLSLLIFQAKQIALKLKNYKFVV